MKLKNLFLKFNPASATLRNAYLLLVKTNFKGAANIPYRAAKDKRSAKWKKLSDYWKKLGGNPKTLDLAIQQGMRLEYKHHKKDHKESKPVFIGANFDNFECMEADTFAPAIATAAIAALPVILKVAAMLKQPGDEKHIDDVEAAAAEGAESIIKENKLKPNADGSFTIDDKHIGMDTTERESKDGEISLTTGRYKYLIPFLAVSIFVVSGLIIINGSKR